MAKFHTLRVRDIHRETDDCVCVSFEVPEALKKEFEFLPGQHLTLRTWLNGEEIRRNYSLCTSPAENDLRVAVKKLAGGQFSTFVNEKLQVGDMLDVMTPTGNFYLPLHSSHQKHYAAFAAGSGITPIISTLKAVLETEPGSRFTLFYANKNTASVIFREELENLKNKYMERLAVHHILSMEDVGSELFYGRINPEKCNAYLRWIVPPDRTDEYLICGPQGMMETVRESLLRMGVAPERIHYELFTTGVRQHRGQDDHQAKNLPKGVHSKITITLDNKTFTLDYLQSGKSILDAASATGADLPYACKGGVCCTCKAKVLEGTVEMEVNYGLTAEEVSKGYILTCQSYPKTEQLIISFDE